jgi:hypothetical protein
MCRYGFRLPGMDAEIRPEPPGEEREAILRAVEELLTGDQRPPAQRSAWREQGIRENAEDGEVEEPV